MANKFKFSLLCLLCSFITPSVAVDFQNIRNLADTSSVSEMLATEEPVVMSPYASVVTDPECKHPVVSFDVQSQFVTISKVSFAIARNGGDYREGLSVAKNMNWLPIELEMQLGQEMHELRLDGVISRSGKNKKYQKLYAKADSTLSHIIKALPEKLPFDVKLFITTEHGVNASAQPGGYIYVSKAAVQKSNDFLAVILAHELFHITQKHTTKQYQATIIDSINTVDQLKGLISSSVNPSEIVSFATLTANLILSYGKNQEAQADVCAGRLLKGVSGYNARKGVNEFLTLTSKHDKQSTKTLFSSHPSYDERAELFSWALNDSSSSQWQSAEFLVDSPSNKLEPDSTVNLDKEKITALLKKAESQFSVNKLTSPQGDCALDSYQLILSSDPTNSDAIDGIDNIVMKYTKWGQKAFKDRNVEKTQKYLDKAEALNPNHSSVKALKQQILVAKRDGEGGAVIQAEMESLAITSDKKSIELQAVTIDEGKVADKKLSAGEQFKGDFKTLTGTVGGALGKLFD